jgi:cell division protein FtsW (lipid II flippase)
MGRLAANDFRGSGSPRVSLERVLNPGILVVLPATALSIIGVVAIGTTEPGFASRHLVYLLVGVAAAAAVGWSPWCRPSNLERWSPFLFAGSVLLLLIVIAPGVPESIVRARNGARRWISLGITDIQPAEIAKVAFLLMLATLLQRTRSHRTLRGLLLPGFLALVPAALIALEPDLDTTLLFVPVLVGVLLAAGCRKRHIALFAMCAALVAPAAFFGGVLKPHQRARVDAYIAQLQGDTRYRNDIGYQADRATTLIGAGGMWGMPADEASVLIERNRLPEDHNDMVFSVICCRWGMAGAIGVWVLVAVFSIGCFLVAHHTHDPWSRLVAVGAGCLVGAQAIINTGMNIGALPIAGITLPFVSYGGSSLVVSWMLVGLVYGLALWKPRGVKRESFEFDDDRRPREGGLMGWLAP